MKLSLISHSALRLRYNLPITLPHSAVLAPPTLPDGKPAPLPPRVPSTGGPGGRRKDLPRIDFDPLVVAKRTEGWEAMLRSVVSTWVEDAARETRGEATPAPGRLSFDSALALESSTEEVVEDEAATAVAAAQ